MYIFILLVGLLILRFRLSDYLVKNCRLILLSVRVRLLVVRKLLKNVLTDIVDDLYFCLYFF
jgi:hypothetical protein